MEILKGYESEVKFVIPASLTAATFVVKKNGLQVGQPGSARVSGGFATVSIPYEAVLAEGQISVELSFLYEFIRHTQSRSVFVTTPLLELYEVKAVIEEPITDIQAKEAEASVRYIIDSSTGQSFGWHHAVYNVSGNNSGLLGLPERLINVTRFNGSSEAGYVVSVTGDGWYLSVRPGGIPPTKADFYGLHRARGGVIENPYNMNIKKFLSDATYTIEGVWGWPTVPEPIKEAARLLINDYFDADSIYRDRYLTSMTAADWRIQFNDEAFTNTGNARADKLLADYVMPRGWLVI